MRRSVRFSLTAVLALAASAGAAEPLRRDKENRWVRTVRGTETVPAGASLRINAHGPVTFTGEGSDALSYSVDVAVKARDEAAARKVLDGFRVQIERRGGWITVTTPRGPAVASMSIAAPRQLREVIVSTSDGGVRVNSVDSSLRVDSAAGPISVQRAGGDVRIVTGGGDINVGTVEGMLNAVTGGGPISVRSVKGEAVLETAGGSVTVDRVMGPLRAATAGGAVQIGHAGAAVTATSGGGSIVIGHAEGVVTARNLAGPVQVGSAGGVRCETGSGAIRLSNVAGAVKVSTSMGSISAGLAAGKLAESFLTTGNGDITVLIPSNLGVTIRAENEMADTMQRIVSEFPGIPVRLHGTQVVAEGPINGGGPLVRISGTGGTIFIKRQQ